MIDAARTYYSMFLVNSPKRLVGGVDDTEGAIQVYYNTNWRSICNEGFGDLEANVVCRELGFW